MQSLGECRDDRLVDVITNAEATSASATECRDDRLVDVITNAESAVMPA